MVIGQAAKRREQESSASEAPPQMAAQPLSPTPRTALAPQPSSPTSEFSAPSLSTPAASSITSPPSPAVPAGRATLMATLRERNKQSRGAAPHPAAVEGAPALASTALPFREGPMPPGPEGRARLLETLRVKSRQQQQQSTADRARAIARVMAERSASSGVSAPSSSPPASTTSPSAGESLALDTSMPVPPSHEEKGLVEEERGVTQMTGGLEWLKMGEKADVPPVVMKGSAGTTVKLGTNYIRLELAQDKGMWEYEVKFSPSVDSKDERHKLLQQHRFVPFYFAFSSSEL